MAGRRPGNRGDCAGATHTHGRSCQNPTNKICNDEGHRGRTVAECAINGCHVPVGYTCNECGGMI